ncbi:hypothetical protein QQ045_029174 [Rhodiola kirilowii]
MKKILPLVVNRIEKDKNTIGDRIYWRTILLKVLFFNNKTFVGAKDDRCYTNIGIRIVCRSMCRAYKDGHIFDPLLAGISPRVTYKVIGSTYDKFYYLVDGIYPRYSFVKTIPIPQTDAEKLFAKKQESYRKDVKSCFRILQSRWAILHHACMTHQLSVLIKVMLACIIMHNMIIEEEFVEEELWRTKKKICTTHSTVYDGPVDPNGSRIHHDPVERAERSEAFHNRLSTLQYAYVRTQLQSDLVKHNWVMATGEEL